MLISDPSWRDLLTQYSLIALLGCFISNDSRVFIAVHLWHTLRLLRVWLLHIFVINDNISLVSLYLSRNNIWYFRVRFLDHSHLWCTHFVTDLCPCRYSVRSVIGQQVDRRWIVFPWRFQEKRCTMKLITYFVSNWEHETGIWIAVSEQSSKMTWNVISLTFNWHWHFLLFSYPSRMEKHVKNTKN
jgi:hypothetical protein